MGLHGETGVLDPTDLQGVVLFEDGGVAGTGVLVPEPCFFFSMDQIWNFMKICWMHSQSCMHEGGGYELLHKAEGNTKLLDVIPVPLGGYTASFLKDIVMQAKVYIHPIQKDLSLEPGQLSGTGGNVSKLS